MRFVCVRLQLIPSLAFKIKNQDVTPKPRHLSPSMLAHTEEVGAIGKAAKQSGLVSFKELLLANSIQIDALTQLLIEAGLTLKRGLWLGPH
jgi:hypothetical protein